MTLHKSSGKWRLGLGLSLITVVLWGILPIALTITLQGLDVYTVTWFRFLIAFIILGLYLTAKQQLPTIQKLRSVSIKLLIIAVIFLATNYGLFLFSLKLTSPSNAQVIMQIAPILMGLGGLFIFKEHYTIRQWIGMGVLTLGFILFFHTQLQVLVNSTSTYLIGSGITLISAVAWAIYGLAQKQLLQKISSSTIMLLIYGFCVLLFTPMASPQRILSMNSLQFGTLSFCCLNTVIAYGAFAESLEHWEASKVSAILTLTPIITLTSMWFISSSIPNIIHPEHISLLGLVGAFLVIFGSMTIALKQ